MVAFAVTNEFAGSGTEERPKPRRFKIEDVGRAGNPNRLVTPIHSHD
jgi:hypothetical protein